MPTSAAVSHLSVTREHQVHFSAMSALRDLIQGEAELDDEEGEESFDEDTGEVRRRQKGANGVNGHVQDSSEEEEDDEDEEAARAVSIPCQRRYTFF